MYRGFPNFTYRGMVEEVVKIDDVRNELRKYGFLIEEKHGDGKGKSWNEYMLGPNALSLVSSWKSEELTERIKKLTIWIIGITGIVFLINLISLIVLLSK